MPIKDPKTRKLSKQQRAAVEARSKPDCKSNTDAVRAAYPKAKNWSPKTIQNFAYQLFSKPHIEHALEMERNKVRSMTRKKSALTADRIIEEFRAIALASLDEIIQYKKKVGPKGEEIYVMNMTEFDKIPEHTRRAMKKIKIKAIPKLNDDGETDHIVQEVELEMYDKQKSLDSLAKYFDLYVEKLEVHHTGTVGHVHTTMQELRSLFDSMSPDERAQHLDKLMTAMEGN